MKLSTILLLGANLIAVPSAVAADTSDWLKANLAEIKQESQSTQQRAVAKSIAKSTVSSKHSTTLRASTVAKQNANPVMLRAFQPGRSLPRKKDLVAQYAQLDSSMSMGMVPQQASTSTSTSMDPNSQLNGRVCAFQQPAEVQQQSAYHAWANVAAKAAKNEAIARPVKAAVRNVMAKAPAGMIPQGMQNMIPPGLSMPPQPQQMQQMVAVMPPSAAPVMPAQMQMRPPAVQSNQPVFSAEDEAAFNRILSGNTRGAGTPTGDMTKHTGNPASGAGQAPFPLNLLFGNSTQATAQGPVQKPSNPLRGKPKFGAWHSKNQLAYGGFGGSNITRGHKRKKANVSHSVPARVSTRRPAATTVAKKRNTAPVTVSQSSAKMPATVAQYPPYAGNYSRPF